MPSVVYERMAKFECLGPTKKELPRLRKKKIPSGP